MLWKSTILVYTWKFPDYKLALDTFLQPKIPQPNNTNALKSIFNSAAGHQLSNFKACF